MPDAGITPVFEGEHPGVMSTFPLHTRATAPFEAKPFLEQAVRSMGHIPSLLAQMAEAPALLEGYASLSAIFRKSSFTPLEQQLVLLVISVANDSAYCTPAHAARARQADLDSEAVADARAGRPLADPRLEILRRFTLAMIDSRGVLADADLDAFIAAGFTRAQVLEVILAVGLKTLSNYVAHVARTPPDPRTPADARAIDLRVA